MRPPYPHHPTSPDDPILDSPRFERHIYLLRSQLHYDIQAQCEIISKGRQHEDNTERQTAFVQGDDTYRPLFDRWITKYLMLAKTRMAAFILEKFRLSKTVTISQQEEIDIELHVPREYNDTRFEALAQSVHDYIVTGVVSEYIALALPANDPLTVNKRKELEVLYDDIKGNVCATQPGTVRKKYHPF